MLFLISTASFGAEDLPRLNAADSLFDEEKYTEAMESYLSLFEDDFSTPSMLLKMAYVADATGNYPFALYYLDRYYKISGDRLTVGKIKDLAEANDLSGYVYSDVDYLAAVFSKYKIVVFALILAVLLSLTFYTYKKAHLGERPYAVLVIQFFLGGVLFIMVNFKTEEKAIIISNQSLLRSGPSAGAEPVTVIDRGHKITILEKSDVWSRILWDGDEVFIRSSRIKLI
ncbi:MAG: SH3 domain-containing protein [Ekhidna sp.]|nr:SH3 domain-containing protein [Ekhidna sp.]